MGNSLYDKLKERDKMHEQIGEERGKIESIRNAMKNFKLTEEQAMEGLGIPKSEYKKFLGML